MIYDASKVFVSSSRVEYATLADSVVIVDTRAKHLVRLNSTGSAIWEMLDGRTVRDISRGIAQQFEVDDDAAERDVHEFLEMMVARGYVVMA